MSQDATGAPVLVVLTRRGLGLAHRLAADLPGSGSRICSQKINLYTRP